MNKEKRKERYFKNIEKQHRQNEESWKAGKLIEPQMSAYNVPWPLEFCNEFGSRLIEILKASKESILAGEMDNFEVSGVKYTREDLFIFKFRPIKTKIIDYILHYPQGSEKSKEYLYLKKVLETYWDEPKNLLNQI